jgi:hypothetical protein
MCVLFVSTATSCIVNYVMMLFMAFAKRAVIFNGNKCVYKNIPL